MSGGAGEVPDRALSLPHVWRGARNACWYTNSTVILPGLEALEGCERAPLHYRSTVSYYRRGGESTLATSLSGRSNERVSTSNNNDNTYAQYLTSTVSHARTVANRARPPGPARAAARAGVRGRAGAPRANALYTRPIPHGPRGSRGALPLPPRAGRSPSCLNLGGSPTAQVPLALPRAVA